LHGEYSYLIGVDDLYVVKTRFGDPGFIVFPESIGLSRYTMAFSSIYGTVMQMLVQKRTLGCHGVGENIIISNQKLYNSISWKHSLVLRPI
jgi:hypothetical protein